MKKAYLISTGTELLLGTTADTNSVFISQQLDSIGIRVIGKSTVGDNEATIRNAFLNGLELADIVISSGGMGPTFDDMTKTVACDVMGVEMQLRDTEVDTLKEFFNRRQRPMPEINLKQAMFPPEAIVLKNPLGTAPGMYLRKNDKVIVLLPGPPAEMQMMYRQELEPLLKKEFMLQSNQTAVRSINVLGLGESKVEEMLSPVLNDCQGCSLALLARDGEVKIRVTAEGENHQHSQEILDKLTTRIVGLMGDYVFGFDEETLVQKVAQLLQKEGKSIATAESCTGGWLSKMITDLPGSSKYYWGSVISYSNEAKVRLLGVKEETLAQFGAVSEQTAREMAYGIRQQSGAAIGVAITGIAGPDGGSEDKPVGLVYIAVAEGNDCLVKEMRFVGSREAIRILAAKSALDLVRKRLLDKKE
ncbi:MAG: competence/damage-inducible protein A [Syntrophomonadaceae bacterium]